MFIFHTRSRRFFSFTVSGADTKVTEKQSTHNAAPIPSLREGQYFSQASHVIFERCRTNVYNGYDRNTGIQKKMLMLLCTVTRKKQFNTIINS